MHSRLKMGTQFRGSSASCPPEGRASTRPIIQRTGGSILLRLTSRMHVLLRRCTAFVPGWRRRRALRQRFARLIDARQTKKAAELPMPQGEARDIGRVLERWRASLSDG